MTGYVVVNILPTKSCFPFLTQRAMTSKTLHLLLSHPKVRLFGRVAVVVCFIAITWLALLTRDFQSFHAGGDKLNHFMAFFTLALGLRCFWSRRNGLVFLLLLGYGVLIEIAQYFIPGRYASVRDVLADVVGIGAGLAVAFMLERLAGRSWFMDEGNREQGDFY